MSKTRPWSATAALTLIVLVIVALAIVASASAQIDTEEPSSETPPTTSTTEASSDAPVSAPGVPPLTRNVHIERYRCGGPRYRWCGSVDLPLDRTDPKGTTIEIGFTVFERRDTNKRALTPIVAQEGGPGYPSIGSRSYFTGLFRPLMDRRDLLLIDARGTGKSSPINCLPLQKLGVKRYDEWVMATGKCGRQLGNASDMYSTAHAADDMADVINALGYRRVNLYGDSYGTFFGQTFAVRHPGLVRTLVLDAAYPVEGQDVWDRDWIASQVDAYRYVCERRPECEGDPIERLEQLLDEIREDPITGRAKSDDGDSKEVTIDPGVMLAIFTTAGYQWNAYRDFDAAVKAALDGNERPILRLARNTLYLGGGGPYRAYSQGEYYGVTCLDYPQVYDLSTPVNTRKEQWDEGVAELEATDPDAWYPFQIQDMLSSPSQDYDSCMKWPVPDNPVPPMPEGHTWPDMPVLVMVGDLDSVTSPAGAKIVADQFPNSTFITVPNNVHVTALADRNRCNSKIVRRFVETKDVGDTSCVTTDYPEVRALTEYPTTAADIDADTEQDRAVLAAKDSVGDVIARWYYMYNYIGGGLYGGSFHTSDGPIIHWTVNKYKFMKDVKMDGHIKLNRLNGNGFADVRLSGRGVPPSELHFRWNDYDLLSEASVTGTVGDDEVEMQVPAPNGI